MRHLLVLLLALAATASQAQSVRYVTDSLKLEARSGPSTENRIMRMLESGTRVQVLEERDGWSRIAGDGDDLWILSRYLMDEPSARNRLDDALTARDAAQAEARQVREEDERALASIKALEEERDGLAARLQTLASELAELKRTAASAVAIQEENRKLRTASGTMEADLTTLREQLLLLKRRQEKEWFLAGAGVLLGGMLLGIVIPKIRWKRKRGWGEL